jgi:hypothetical protein
MNYFKNARFRQCQEQRRVKAHGRQANLDFLKKFARLEFQLQAGEQFQVVELSLTAIGYTRLYPNNKVSNRRKNNLQNYFMKIAY